MKSANEVLTEVEHLDNLARASNDVAHGKAAIALLDELSERQKGASRWSTMAFALRLRLAWIPEDPALDSFFERFVRDVEEGPHADVVQRKVARSKIFGAMKDAPKRTATMNAWIDTTDWRVTQAELKAVLNP